MRRTIEAHCAQKLRELRRAKGITLNQFEKLSNGAIKAVVLGSYERGTRAISLARLEELAEIYEVPIQYFWNEKLTLESPLQERLIFDLRRLRKSQDISHSMAPVERFLATIARKRSDWNGEVMSIRANDSETLSLLCDLDQSQLREELRLRGYLFASEVSGQRSL
jgi:transcriptional regulator with XRE-family HTH domain